MSKPKTDIPNIDETLHTICYHERALADAKAVYDDALMRAKAKHEETAKPHREAIKGLVKTLRTAAQKLRDGWKNKSLTLPWGVVSFRDNPRHLVLQDGVSEADALKLVRGFHPEAIITTFTVSLEVLERAPADVIAEVGYRWSDPRETFDYKTKLTLEQEQSQPKLKKPAA